MDTRTHTLELAHRGSWKLAACASLALLITLLSASAINRSVVPNGVTASQPSVALQAAADLPTVIVAASR
jgi:hypothetical protein